MPPNFFEQPILNSPYTVPTRHHALDDDGQPLNVPPVDGRRQSKLITPVPKARKKQKKSEQASFVLSDPLGLSTEDQEYNPTPIINEIRSYVAIWRAIPNPNDWGVTAATQRLLTHWRTHQFDSIRPFFCQIEAVETVIWLTEVARKQRRYSKFQEHLRGANEQANPELFRVAMKMATGSGKTTVMAMLIAWQTINAVRMPGSDLYSRGFLIVTPGITIKDRLRVLMPNDPDSYYASRELVPTDMLSDLGRAKIVITNYHAFKHRETLEISKTGRSLLQGREAPPQTIENDGQMLARVCNDLMGFKGVVVLNDEAHHCYREKPVSDEEIGTDEREEAKKNSEAARLWIAGLEALKRKLGITALYDLSATPFFLRGSGYREGTLFPWTVSDFSLMDAIECGIVKLPRIPVADNAPNAETPIYRNLWDHIGKKMPKAGRAKGGKGDPLGLPNELYTALYALYGHYEKTYDEWSRAGIEVPPVFIVVCNNTSTSELVYEWISGFERDGADEQNRFMDGHLKLFRNYDEHGARLARPNTLLIDSEQVDSGEALDAAFRATVGPEIEQFRREKMQRDGAGAGAQPISDEDLLREVMNTVGRKGRLGETVRCVVSVSMLTEGWDTNTVTHILGVRAFGTQLLCEQVVGRGLRRQSYALNDQEMFDVEYADIMGIPFDFAAQPVVAKPKPPKPTTQVKAMKERAALEITFPRVEGYRVALPDERVEAVFSDDSRLVLTPEKVGPCRVLLEGIVGEGVELTTAVLEAVRPSEISYHLAKHLLYNQFRDPGEPPKMHLFGQIKRAAKRWIDEGYLVCLGGTTPAMVTYRELADQASELIFLACQTQVPGTAAVKAILDPYTPRGSTRFINFNTSKPLYTTDPAKCHVNYAVLDSDWEAEFARAAEAHPQVLSYVKNQGMQFEVPYRNATQQRRYWPDYIVRIDDGGEDPLNLVVEIKGYRNTDAQLKAETMRKLWVPGVNNLGGAGRWAFAEFIDVFEIESAFRKLIAAYTGAPEAV
ncbi:BPTD_3080 family restriction endonuclease [Paracraurococcus lichenis]|uniref:DEAD/DEAH box helicase family protein n=1 Tax=Paracraurococcus lichenis TaxID=3064888 RepID=A0ABT9E3L8_9PROT|nr:DEAD/DEAH box helicase family protein [Paracraurococcus sp. LOR1-02]MDO9710758.1 DEAD/DEAH box helicase family protein [Paracraurococcus sp. LOR1-02]